MRLADAASRRSFLRLVGPAAGGTAATIPSPATKPTRYSFQRVVDLTHTLSANFPMSWPNGFALEQVSRLGKDKWNAYRWHLQEHIGTHLDAPLHCSQGPSGDRISASELVGPLVVVDIRAAAATNADAQLTPNDLKAWERRNGGIPPGAVVALFSGWDARVGDARKYFGVEEGRTGHHSPGFHLDAVQFLQEQRDVKGIATDTMSLDVGASTDFPVHHYWLGHGKWGLENVAGLGTIPARGATIVVGSPKIEGCTGGPSRVLALL
jgi:kynurenine formamidase